MIKNERQYKITKAAAERFERALQQFEASPDDAGLDPMIVRAEREGLESQLQELRAQVSEYEALVSGRTRLRELWSIDELPEALIRARIAAGLSQKDLASLLDMKEQQIQRYEATDYQSASLERLLGIARVLKLQIREELLLPASTSADVVTRRLEELGLSREFVRARLTPHETKKREAADISTGIARAVRAISHVFGWSRDALLGSDRPWLEAGVLGAVRYKVSAAADRKKVSVYSIYAHYLALQALQATEGLRPAPLSTDPAEWRASIVREEGDLSFASVVKYAWKLGIVVVPLTDAGAFHGAFWRVDGRNVIVLKQKTPSLSRWAFDLLHEIWHATQEPELPSRSILEGGDMAICNIDSEEEKDASSFAGDVLLAGRAEELVDACVERAGGRVERLKTVVPGIAANAGVEVDALANYLAFRLSLQNINWWGTAANLQSVGVSPARIARDVLAPHLKWSLLGELDQSLLRLALESEEDEK